MVSLMMETGRATDLDSCHWSTTPPCQLPLSSCGLVSGPRLANWQILLTFCLQHEGASINLLQQFIHYLFRILQIYFEFYPIFPTSSRYLGMMMMMMMGSTKHLVWVDIFELFAQLRRNQSSFGHLHSCLFWLKISIYIWMQILDLGSARTQSVYL